MNALPTYVRCAITDMFEDDMKSVLKSFYNDVDSEVFDFEIENRAEDIEHLQQAYGTAEPCNSQLNSVEHHPVECVPLLNVLLQSREEMRRMMEHEGESLMGRFTPQEANELWGKLEVYLQGYPAVRLLTSETLKRERSQRRILKAKARIITKIQGFINQRIKEGSAGGA